MTPPEEQNKGYKVKKSGTDMDNRHNTPNKHYGQPPSGLDPIRSSQNQKMKFVQKKQINTHRAPSSGIASNISKGVPNIKTQRNHQQNSTGFNKIDPNGHLQTMAAISREHSNGPAMERSNFSKPNTNSSVVQNHSYGSKQGKVT